MADLFLYGTLSHLPLLERVLGRDVGDLGPAWLDGWKVSRVAGESFPMIHESKGGAAHGLLLRDPGADDLARLDHYEGGYGYALKTLQVRSDAGAGPAQVYLPDAARWTPGAAWDQAAWVEEQGALALEAATEVMERFGTTSAQEMGRLFPWIRARAWARLLARDTAPCELRQTPRKGAFRIEKLHKGFDGFFRMRVFDLSFLRFDGKRTEPFTREAFVAFDAALVLPYDPVSDKVLLIEQMRFGPIWRGDAAAWVLEPIAGLVDAGEGPADCARREAREEAGIELGELQEMTKVYATPGYSTEFFHCYLGLCQLQGNEGGVAGLAHEHEDIRSHVLSFDRAMALVDSGEINAAPLAMMLLWLARHREELRRKGLPARP